MECKRYILSSYDNLVGECDCYGTKEEPCWGAVHVIEEHYCELCDLITYNACEGHDGDNYNRPQTYEEAKPYEN